MSTKPEANLSQTERGVSALLGAWIFLLGLFRRRTLPTAVGGYLLYRAISGQCKASEFLKTASGPDKAGAGTNDAQ